MQRLRSIFSKATATYEIILSIDNFVNDLIVKNNFNAPKKGKMHEKSNEK